MTWETTEPDNDDFISLGPADIRTLKTDIQTSLRGNAAEGTEAVFPGADAANPVFRYRGLKGTTGARPAATDHGLYFNETLNTIQRSNGSSWVDVGTLIPSGTTMIFYQTNAPTGWTAQVANDFFLRVVNAGGSGGTSGGSGLTPSSTITLNHSHTVDGHTHDLGNHTHSMNDHTHNIPIDGWGSPNSALDGRLVVSDGGGAPGGANTALALNAIASGNPSTANTTTPSSNTSGSTSTGTDGQLADIAFSYIDFILCAKD